MGLGIDVGGSNKQNSVLQTMNDIDLGQQLNNAHSQCGPPSPSPVYATFNYSPEMASDSPASLVSVETSATPDDMRTPHEYHNDGRFQFARASLSPGFANNSPHFSHSPNFSHPLDAKELYHSNGAAIDPNQPIEIPHPINSSMNYSLRRRSLGQLETALVSEILGFRADNNQQPPLVALLPMYLSPNLDSLSTFPYKNSITPTMVRKTASMEIIRDKVEVSKRRQDQNARHGSSPQQVTFQSPDRSRTHSTIPRFGIDDCSDSPILGTDNLFITRHNQRRDMSTNGLRVSSAGQRRILPSKEKNDWNHFEADDFTPLWNLSEKVVGPRECTPLLAWSIIAAGVFFPPIWLLIGGGSFDQAVGVVRRQEKQASLALAFVFFVIVVACIIVGFVIGEGC